MGNICSCSFITWFLHLTLLTALLDIMVSWRGSRQERLLMRWTVFRKTVWQAAFSWNQQKRVEIPSVEWSANDRAVLRGDPEQWWTCMHAQDNAWRVHWSDSAGDGCRDLADDNSVNFQICGNGCSSVLMIVYMESFHQDIKILGSYLIMKDNQCTKLINSEKCDFKVRSIYV